MNYIKKHKLTSFIILVYIKVIIFAYFIYKLFIGSSGLPVYGDRLDGIEDVPITDEQKSNIKNSLLEENFVLKVTDPYLNGKILKVIITVGDNAELAASKALTDKVTEVLTDEQKAFYDVTVYVTKYYHCSLAATGKMDEDGNFTDTVTIEFEQDPSKNEFALDYGISKSETVDYNKEQKITIEEDGEYTVYGFTKDKSGETKCNIKIVKTASEDKNDTQTVKAQSASNFPIIGYKKAGVDGFVWTKDR